MTKLSIIDNGSAEKWKSIDSPKYPKDKYYISNQGRVFNSHTKQMINSRPYNVNGYRCKLKDEASQHYYHKITLYNTNKKPSVEYIHRLVANAFLRKVKGKNEIDHIDNNPLNNCVTNLRWVTHRENRQVLTEEQVDVMLKLIHRGWKPRQIKYAARCSAKNVYNLRNKRIWLDRKAAYNKSVGMEVFAI